MRAYLWLQPPYYIPPPQVWMSATEHGQSVITLSVESYLQSVLADVVKNLPNFLKPSYVSGYPTKTAAAMQQDYVNIAKTRAAMYPETAVGVDPVALGNQYGQLAVDIFGQVDSGPLGGNPGMSMLQMWTDGLFAVGS